MRALSMAVRYWGLSAPLLPAALALCLAVCAAFLTACDMGGSGTETSNGEIVAGRVFVGNGPAAGASVHVRSAEFLRDTSGIDSAPAPTPPDAVTDKNGYFRLRSPGIGAWKAEVRDGVGKAVLVGFDVKPGAKALELAPDTLRPVGALQGQVELPPGISASMYVQVYGLDRAVRTDTAGLFAIRDLPAGPIKFRVLSSRAGTSYPSPALAVIAPGDTVDAGTLKPVTFATENYSEWPFSRRIYLNTQAAGVHDTVTDFPLLVRLDASRLDFDLSDGKDIRFSSQDGAHLPYQLDSWNPVARQAAFWVRLDTVFGNSRQQYITLYFGKRDAPDFSDGKAVFSSFGGVWHFSEPVDDLGEGFFADASPSMATGAARIFPADRQGVIGSGAAFRNTHNVVANGTAAMAPPLSLTVSAWVLVQGTGAAGADLISMGDNYGLRSEADGNAHFFAFTDTSVKSPVWGPKNFFNSTETKGLDLRGTWRHFTGRYDGSTLKVFVDGEEKSSNPLSKAIHYIFSKEMKMGIHGNGNTAYRFTGSLDEVQVSPVVRSAAWIELSYQSQRPGSTLLEFR